MLKCIVDLPQTGDPADPHSVEVGSDYLEALGCDVLWLESLGGTAPTETITVVCELPTLDNLIAALTAARGDLAARLAQRAERIAA